MLLDLAASRRVLFVGGKGGVGKTATASAAALHQARLGRTVLVVSTDPAHNLGHLWECAVGDETVTLWQPDVGAAPDARTAGRLDGVEVDPQATIGTHLEEVGRSLRDFMPEHLHRQVDQHLALAAQSPGTHESALLERIALLLETALDTYDLVVFDTAPSGHTARLMALPETMTAWTEGLLNRRSKAERFGAAVRALDGDDDPESSTGTNRDRRIRQILTRRRNRFEGLRAVLTDADRCSFVIVLTPERLPVLESVELHAQLTGSGVDVGGCVVNRISPADQGDFLASRREQELNHLATLQERLPGVRIDSLPLLGGDLVGEVALGVLADHLV